MALYRKLSLPLAVFSVMLVLAGCHSGPSVSGSFDRSYAVTGPIRLELTNASGGRGHHRQRRRQSTLRAESTRLGFGFDNPQKRWTTRSRTLLSNNGRHHSNR